MTERYIYTEAYWWRKNATIQNSDNTLADLIGMCYLFFFCRRERASSYAGLRSTLFLRCLQDPRKLAMWKTFVQERRPLAEEVKGEEVERRLRGTQWGLFLMPWVCTAALAFVSCIWLQDEDEATPTVPPRFWALCPPSSRMPCSHKSEPSQS